jgi:tight adherence protein B
MLIFIIFLIFITVGLISYSIIPALYTRAAVFNEMRQKNFTDRMENMMPRQEAQKMGRMFVVAPLGMGVGFFYLFPEEFKLFGVLVGVTIGLVLPTMYIKTLKKKTFDKFGDQLVDALMIMSSSFRGGLSLVQALEAVVEEMPDPINKEFGIVLGENKMGVSLEEAMYHLYNRMPSNALQQMITAILLARETGGNLPIIFTRIVNNIRETKKIQQNLDTLTVQGKIQGIVMALLPIGFGFIVYSANRRIFEHMFTSSLGRGMLIYAFISELMGAFMIWKISKFDDF